MTVLRAALAFGLTALFALPALANWRSDAQTGEGLFYGGAFSQPAALGLRCIGQLPGQPARATDTSQSPPYSFLFEIGPEILPPPGSTDRRNDIGVWVGAQGFQLPQLVWNDLDGVWAAPVLMTDPLITAMRQGGALVAGPISGGQFQIPADNMGVAIEAAMTHCIPFYAGQGQPVPPQLAAFAGGASPEDQERGGDTMEGYANSHIRQGCQGGTFEAEPNHILEGLIDADEQPDYVVDWGKIRCTQGHPIPFCGASQCAADLFLTQSFFPDARPESFLAQGVSLIDLNNGRKGVSLGGSLSMCNAAGKGQNGCQFIWYWDGQQMQQIP